MPFVRISHIRDGLTSEQKHAMLRGVQDAVAAVEGEALRLGVGVVLEESISSRDVALNCLPFVSITLIKGALTPAQKQQMLAGVIEAVVAVEGEERRGQIWAVIEENVLEGEWSIGGHPLTFAAMAAIKEGRNPWP